jgi:hypothetical protein
MGNSIKRQVLTAAVTLGLFTLGSVGVSDAGLNLVSRLDGKLKGGKEWCGSLLGQAAGTENAIKEKIKEDVAIWVEFSDFPDVTAVVRQNLRDIPLDGWGLRKNDKKGFFSIDGGINQEIEPGFDPDLETLDMHMEGEYKVNEEGTPIKIKGTFQYFNIINPLAEIDAVCLTNKGKFDAKGDGSFIAFPDE